MEPKQHIVIHRPIADVGRHQWDFYADGDEIKLHSYEMQQYYPKTAQFEMVSHYLEGGSCTHDRLNVPMPSDVVRELYREFADRTLCAYVGPHYDSVADLLADNPDLASKAIDHLITEKRNRQTTPRSR